MTKIRNDVNEFGSPVSVHLCAACGDEFTVCPPADENFGGCLAPGCASYDPARDVDKLFDEGSDAIVRLPNAWPPSQP